MSTVRYDHPSARKHQRVIAPAWVDLDGARFPTVNWCVGGFCIAGYPGEAQVGERRPIRFFVKFQGFEIGFDAVARFCGLDPARERASVEFVELGHRESELLRHFVLGVTTGEISSVSDTLVHMDSPTSVATWNGGVPSEDVHARERRRRRSILRASVYLLAGLLLTAYVLMIGYERFFRLEIDTATVMRPIETVVAQGVGQLEKVLVETGQNVVAGQALFTAVDEGHGRDLQAKTLELSMARVEFQAAESARATAQRNFRIYEGIVRHKQKAANERVNSLTIECKSAEKNLARVESLVQGGLATSAALDEATAFSAKLQGELSTAVAEATLASDAVEAAAQGCFYDGFRLVGELPEATAREDAAKARVQIAEQQLAAAREGSGQSTYTAPFASRVLQIAKSPGSTVNRGETLALLERIDDEPKIQALITEDQATHIRLGEQATVRMPTLRQSFDAVVVRSDKTGPTSGGLPGDLLWGAAQHRASDLTAVIELELLSLTPGAKGTLRSGMPVIVSLARRSARVP